MPRTKSPDPTTRIYFNLPSSLLAPISLQLYSSVEGRVPYGAWTELLKQLLHQHLQWGQLDLAPYGLPPGFFVRGPKEMIAALEARLKEAR